MKGWLIYEKGSAKKNESGIRIYIEEAGKSNVALELKTDGYYSFYNEPLPDFAIMRTYDYTLSRALENRGVRVFNNSFVSEICNDKEKTYLYAKKHSIPVMETVRYIPGGSIPFDYPVVVKPAGGHGGAGVALACCPEELETAVSKIKNDKILLQRPASTRGKDLRVYVIGNEIICGMMRESATDFRSNFSLGGSARQHSLSEKEAELVGKVTSVFNFDYAGIDIIYDNGDPVLNEIEDVAGARMLYMNTDINIIKLYMDHIVSVMH